MDKKEQLKEILKDAHRLESVEEDLEERLYKIKSEIDRLFSLVKVLREQIAEGE
jgi:uncharacterized small protein (DUF1192 family)